MPLARRPLALPGFRHLVATYTVNEVGNWLGEIALTVLVYEHTGSPLAAAALFLGMQFVPAFFAPAVVARSETLGFRYGLIFLYASEGLVLCALAILATHFVLPIAIALAAMDGVLGLAARSLSRGAAASIAQPAGLLREGNVFINFGFAGAAALGPALAGLAVATIGTQGALLLDAASFLAVSITLLFARGLGRGSGEPTTKWTQRLREAATYVKTEPRLRLLIGGQAIAYLFFSVVLPIEIVYATDVLNVGSSGYGALLAAWGGGMIIGSIVFAIAKRVSVALLIIGGTVLTGLAYVGMAAADSILLACVAAGFGGLANGVQWVSVLSAIQSSTKHAFQARVMSFLEALVSVTIGLGFLLGGLLTQLSSARVAFSVAGAGALLTAALLAPAVLRINLPAGRTGEMDDAYPRGPLPASSPAAASTD